MTDKFKPGDNIYRVTPGGPLLAEGLRGQIVEKGPMLGTVQLWRVKYVGWSFSILSRETSNEITREQLLQEIRAGTR